jgi:hypothetical protein
MMVAPGSGERGRRVQGFKGSRVQGFKSSRVQEFKGICPALNL